jgi:hypothetical protein
VKASSRWLARVDVMMRRLAWWLLALLSIGLLAGAELRGEEEADREAAALTEGVQRTKASLIRGLSASARHGEPIAVTFTLQDGKLQLSVCTVRRETFRHVILDPTTWKVVAVEPIPSGDALAAAHARRAVLARAKWSVRPAAVNILKAHRGFSLVSTVPSLKAMERPVAEVTLVKGDQWNTVAEMLN